MDCTVYVANTKTLCPCFRIYKTAITLTSPTSYMFKLTSPTVGRQMADLSTDDRSIYRPIKCKILALFSSADKKYIITTLLYFFSIGRQFWGFGNRPMVRRRSAVDRPISRPMSYLNWPHIIGRCVGRPSADNRPTIGRSSLATFHRPMCRPTVGRRSADC